ncbi:AGE family epimerase/isomerase [uncultured Brevundimonas sp.]|uniref:AGE family epimerase/isomerase n=1 Tax=uncultured Brevundimonas sp. TaxID=213418 RepID=UPI0030EEAF54|tara:strand:- start:73046 stop:75259 length:2214 start_codon:yes stop_codon:yes gene_type:complete
MVLFPVIMCGGVGTRLWPASRPSRPKQFLPLVGHRSLFQETVIRVAPLVRNGGRLVVVGGLAHRHWIIGQLAELGVEAQVLLEPEGRDSAPAMAAAAVWVSEQDPEGIVAFLASDHHIPDHPAFREAVVEAARASGSGRIVTLGVRPTEPSSAYGYIKPTGPGLSDVAAFVEKPDAATAGSYIRDGYLWNSGNFIVPARTLLDELRTFAPEIETAVRAALNCADTDSVQTLADSFRHAPRISIDYAVMEKTRRAAVLEVDFAWSDLGAWDAIAAASQDDDSQHVRVDTANCLIRAPASTLVATLGVRNLAIIAEADAILVCDLDRGQEVKAVVEQIRRRSPEHLDFSTVTPEPLVDGGRRFADWLRLRALPIWSTLGQAGTGLFLEALTLEGRVAPRPHRARVQARQIFVYTEAGRLGWTGPWQRIVSLGVARLLDSHLRDDGLSRSLVSDSGASLDDTARLYDQAFVLLALATVRSAGVDAEAAEAAATRLRETLLTQTLPNGGFREAGDHPYQANAHMHLLEACLAWEAAGGDAGWSELADRLVVLAFDAFIDAEGGFLREFFNADWTPAEGGDGTLIEPGHQFEWAWLLTRYGRSRGNARALAAATRLYAAGRRGVAEHPAIIIDALNTDGSVRSRQARLWPQSEWLKAALILAETASPDERIALLEDAATALRALWLYLTPGGLWHDKHLPGGGFVAEPAPASSLYHIMAGFQQLAASWPMVADDDEATLTLG